MNADIHSLVGAYAVDAVDDAERAAFEKHLDECAECRAEVASLRAAAGDLSHLTEVTPPADLKQSVMGRVAATRPLPPLSAPPAEPADNVARPAAWHRRPATWLAAAAAAVAIVVGGLVWSPWSGDQQPSLTQQVIAAKDAQRFVKTVDGARATVVRSRSLGKAVLIADNMPGAPAGKDFQVWLQRPDGSMVSAALMPHTHAATVTVLLDGDAATATGAGITLEPAGGSSQPTSDPVALFAFT